MGFMRDLVRQPTVKKMLPIIIILMVVAAFALASLSMKTPSYRPLSMMLSDPDKQVALEALRSADFKPYPLDRLTRHAPAGAKMASGKYPTVTGLEHDELGHPTGSAKLHSQMTAKRRILRRSSVTVHLRSRSVARFRHWIWIASRPRPRRKQRSCVRRSLLCK